jgi:hypothetical protein
MIIPIEKARQILGEESKNYDDQQIEEVLNVLTVLADLAIDDFIAKHNLRKEAHHDSEPERISKILNSSLVQVRKRRKKQKNKNGIKAV